MSFMKSVKTVFIGLPFEIGEEIEELAKQERRSVSAVIKEAFRWYRSQKNFNALVKQTQKYAKVKGLTTKDFGGPFED